MQRAIASWIRFRPMDRWGCHDSAPLSRLFIPLEAELQAACIGGIERSTSEVQSGHSERHGTANGDRVRPRWWAKYASWGFRKSLHMRRGSIFAGPYRALAARRQPHVERHRQASHRTCTRPGNDDNQQRQCERAIFPLADDVGAAGELPHANDVGH
jgi:hypothetical protein